MMADLSSSFTFGFFVFVLGDILVSRLLFFFQCYFQMYRFSINQI